MARFILNTRRDSSFVPTIDGPGRARGLNGTSSPRNNPLTNSIDHVGI